jgi:hypothetical protein
LSGRQSFGSSLHGAPLPGSTERNPSGIPAATVSDRCALVSSSFPSRPSRVGCPALSAKSAQDWLPLILRLFLLQREGEVRRKMLRWLRVSAGRRKGNPLASCARAPRTQERVLSHRQNCRKGLRVERVLFGGAQWGKGRVLARSGMGGRE